MTFEELQTIFCNCESFINSHLLTYQYKNLDDLFPLTPDICLDENLFSIVTDIKEVDSKQFFKRLRNRVKLIEILRMRFRRENLGQLIQRRREIAKLTDLNLDELALITDDAQKIVN